MAVEIVLSQRVKLNWVNAKIDRKNAEGILVKSGGFSRDLIIGIIAPTNTQVPIEKTQSCQSINLLNIRDDLLTSNV